MEVILKQDIENLGYENEIVKVKKMDMPETILSLREWPFWLPIQTRKS